MTSVTVIELRKELALEITVLNSGCELERGIWVTAGLFYREPQLLGEAKIDEISPGKEATVAIDHLPLPPIGKRLFLRVDVADVPTEANLDNNSVDFQVRFVPD